MQVSNLTNPVKSRVCGVLFWRSGRRGRRFKSCRIDGFKKVLKTLILQGFGAFFISCKKSTRISGIFNYVERDDEVVTREKIIVDGKECEVDMIHKNEQRLLKLGKLGRCWVKVGSKGKVL